MISIVIPVLNEEDNLPELRRRLLKASDSWGDTFEIVIVDDGSTDRTPAILRSFHEDDPRFKVVRLSRNFGHQVAISAGLEYASGDAAAVMDADLQDGPDELARMLAKWREGYEVVYAVRRRRKENILKQAAYWAFYRLLAWASSVQIPLDRRETSRSWIAGSWMRSTPCRSGAALCAAFGAGSDSARSGSSANGRPGSRAK